MTTAPAPVRRYTDSICPRCGKQNRTRNASGKCRNCTGKAAGITGARSWTDHGHRESCWRIVFDPIGGGLAGKSWTAEEIQFTLSPGYLDGCVLSKGSVSYTVVGNRLVDCQGVVWRMTERGEVVRA